MPRLRRKSLLLAIVVAVPIVGHAQESPLSQKLTHVAFDHFAKAPGYSEGPTWRKGELFFCSGALLRVGPHGSHKYLEINPAGTVLRGDGHLLICDNKHRALLDLDADGKLGVLAERCEMETLRSLNDLTIDARGNVYWTDPEGSSLKNPVGRIYRLRPDGRVDRIGEGLAFPNGIEVDPAGKYLYVIESQSKKILRYEVPGDRDLLGKAQLFYDLGGSGGDGCAFDAAGNLWVADFHRPDAGKGRIAVLSPAGKPLAHLDVPAKVVSNIAFGGPNHDEIFCTTGEPPGVFHAKVGVEGFKGHPGKPAPIAYYLDVVPMRPHADAGLLQEIITSAASAKGKLDDGTRGKLKSIIERLSDPQVRRDAAELLPLLEKAVVRHAADAPLHAEIKRLGGKAATEVRAPAWLRAILGDSALGLCARIVEIELNENTDGHKKPEPKKLHERVSDDWLKHLAGQDQLRRLELSGTAVTSAGLVHLKDLTQLERLNLCLTAVDDRGFEHLAGLTKMKRMVICASKITGAGFKHLQAMKQIESINLHSAPASDEGLEAIGKRTSLKRLEIVHTNVTDAGLKHLVGLVNLQQFHVHGRETTAQALPFLAKLRELYQVDIYDKAASNIALEQLGQLPKLRLLMLVNSICDDEGVKHLAKVTTLEELSVDSNKVTDASMETLGRLSGLRKLSIRGTRISAAGRDRLQKLLPRTTITP